MNFFSILFHKKVNLKPLKANLDFYSDLNLDTVIDSIISYKKEYDIKRFFYMPLDDIDTVIYRQEILKDLQNGEFYKEVDEFCKNIQKIKRDKDFIEKNDTEVYKKSLFYQMMLDFHKFITEFSNKLNDFEIHSRGLILFRKYIENYLQSDTFITMQKKLFDLKKELEEITYDITLDGLTIRVKRYEDEEDYTSIIKEIFKKFEQNEVDKAECHYEKNRGLNHINAKILEFVSKLYPETFKKLDDFFYNYQDIINETFFTFANEAEFYISYIEYANDIKNSYLSFCYPVFSTDQKSITIKDGYDMALAYTLSKKEAQVVSNDYIFEEDKRILVVSGANQGGKSTYARAFGQINYLAKLGLFVCAKEAKIYFYDKIFTHFEKEEQLDNLHSKLQEDLLRAHSITSNATSKSIVILNEIFSSTSLKDALFLSSEIMKTIDKKDLFCIWVTFIEELNDMSKKTKSMVTLIDENNIDKRSYKIVHKKPDGKAYAMSLSKKYHLSYEQILQRIG